jgi:hypothetical protein
MCQPVPLSLLSWSLSPMHLSLAPTRPSLSHLLVLPTGPSLTSLLHLSRPPVHPVHAGSLTHWSSLSHPSLSCSLVSLLCARLPVSLSHLLVSHTHQSLHLSRPGPSLSHTSLLCPPGHPSHPLVSPAGPSLSRTSLPHLSSPPVHPSHAGSLAHWS